MPDGRCMVGKLSNWRPHPTRNDLCVAEIAGHTVVIGDHYSVDNPGFHIPAGAVVPRALLEDMWLWNDELGKGRLGGKGGDRVRRRVIDGVQSDGLFYGAHYFVDCALVESRAWDASWADGECVAARLGITFVEGSK